MKLNVASRRDFPAGLDLPRARRLESRDLPFMVQVSRGLSRNIIRLVEYRDTVHAVREIA